MTEDSDASDNEAFNRNNPSGDADGSAKMNVSSPPFSPVKIVGKSGCLEPYQHEHIQKPKTMSKKMKFTFNDELQNQVKDPLLERPSASIRWETDKVSHPVFCCHFVRVLCSITNQGESMLKV